MNRTIYTFYCYNCHKWQKKSSPIPCVTFSHKLISIFCPTCQKQINLEHTNLDPKRYKINFNRQWQIIDQDAFIPYVVFISEDKRTVKEICLQLNNGIPAITFQDDISTIHDIWDWFVHNSSF